MKLLSIDTATEGCSAALWLDGEIAEEYQEAPREHGRLILPMVDRLLAEAELGLPQLDCLAFGRGPGAFTGVRIATGVVQGLALGADLPVARVSNLAALAQRAWREHAWRKVIVCLDARMREVYYGRYVVDQGSDLVRSDDEEAVIPPAQIPLPEDPGWGAIGRGFRAYETMRRRLGDRLLGADDDSLPRAGDIARLGVADFEQGRAVSAERALPVYLRTEVAWAKAD